MLFILEEIFLDGYTFKLKALFECWMLPSVWDWNEFWRTVCLSLKEPIDPFTTFICFERDGVESWIWRFTERSASAWLASSSNEDLYDIFKLEYKISGCFVLIFATLELLFKCE